MPECGPGPGPARPDAAAAEQTDPGPSVGRGRAHARWQALSPDPARPFRRVQHHPVPEAPAAPDPGQVARHLGWPAGASEQTGAIFPIRGHRRPHPPGTPPCRRTRVEPGGYCFAECHVECHANQVPGSRAHPFTDTCRESDTDNRPRIILSLPLSQRRFRQQLLQQRLRQLDSPIPMSPRHDLNSFRCFFQSSRALRRVVGKLSGTIPTDVTFCCIASDLACRNSRRIGPWPQQDMSNWREG